MENDDVAIRSAKPVHLNPDSRFVLTQVGPVGASHSISRDAQPLGIRYSDLKRLDQPLQGVD